MEQHTITPGFVIWFTGLPASGKSTLAHALSRRLAAQGIQVQVLDSDELRRQLTPHPTYAAAERDWFYDTIIYLAELLAKNGVHVFVAATGSRRAYRDAARTRLPRFAELFVDCPTAVCQQRDPKGLWQQATTGQITTLPGRGDEYEPPLHPELHVNTGDKSVETAVSELWQQLEIQGFLAFFT
ncbi:MAG TPA: adenylyl-sulfate kinase [Chloroflexota bacterium]|nr:adenylyl-sulfate kinase [Chloroflexota bacterium]